MSDSRLRQTVDLIARYYDGYKVGYVGHEGYRKSTDLVKFARCIDEMVSLGLVDPNRSLFLDLGCADGRVNVLMSYFVKISVGIEIDPEILAEYNPRKKELGQELRRANLIQPINNITLFQGNSLEAATYEQIESTLNLRFEDIDIFYTYITLHDLFGAKIAAEAKPKALYLVYGFNKILPRYRGLELLIPNLASEGIVALYGKGSFDWVP
ncbi:MAG: class I SAM-dependent methyltransferase [Deltaproteobacteria bacterium]|nr:MAG: class I SAM-dependent methyltransferase [Deltaproteobacteria bacterium]